MPPIGLLTLSEASAMPMRDAVDLARGVADPSKGVSDVIRQVADASQGVFHAVQSPCCGGMADAPIVAVAAERSRDSE